MPHSDGVTHFLTTPVVIGTLPPGKTVTIVFQATINNGLPPAVTQVAIQGVVSGTNFPNVLTDDPLVVGSLDPTVTLLNFPPTFTAGPPPAAALIGTPYSFTYSATGAPAPTFTVPPATLPTGLSLSPAGAITGTPTTPGTFSGTVTASNGVLPNATQNFSITVGQAPAITNGPPPAAGTVGTAYNFTYTFTGTPTPTLTVTSGALPGGLSMDTAGVISGNPNASGVFSGVVTATNSVGTATQAFSITVSAPPLFTNGPPPTVAVLNQSYANFFTYTASGFPVPTFSVTGGSLPTGLTLSGAGVISGTPTVAGPFSGIVTASNAGGSVTQNFSITVVSKPTLTSPATFDALTATSAGLHSNVTSDGGSAITARGFVIARTTDDPTPTLGELNVTDIPVAGTTGALDGSATGLTLNTGYSFAAYATNAAGTTYTTPVTVFTTPNVTYTLGTNALTEGPAAGTDTVLLSATPSGTNWTATTGDAWLHLSAPNQSGTDSALITFTFDANAGATRTGTINISGQILTITQAGVNYVAANPLTTLVSSGLNQPYSVAVDGAGNVFIADGNSATLKKWTAATQTVSTLVSTGLLLPWAVAVDGAGNVYIADFNGGTIKKWTAATQTVSTLVSGLSLPAGVAVDGAGNVYIGESGSNSVKKWTATTQTVSTLVSTGLNSPQGVAVDVAGNVFIADRANNAIKKWTAATQTVSTLVSTGLDRPYGVAVDGAGNVHIADSGNNAIKVWTAATQTVSTLVSTGLVFPTGVAVDGNGNVYIADRNNSLIKERVRAFVDPSAKAVSALAGTDALPAVLPTGTNLLPPFAPSSDQPWLTIGTITSGVVNFGFTLNNTITPRSGNLTVLGVQTPVNQAADIPASIAVSSGSPQATTVTAPFPAPLKAIVRDSASNPISGVTVTFTAPGSGASGTFAGGVNTAVTDASGIATSAVFTANATDGVCNVAATAPGVGPVNFALTINPPVTISPASLPNWTVNKAGYSQTITGANGTGAKVLSISAGAIPTGMTFTPATGVLNGTPTATGTFNFTITATDSANQTAQQAYTVVINPAVVITTATLPAWTLNKVGYSQAILNTGGTGASTFAVTAGAVPTGLALSTGGVLSGTPTVANTFNFTVTATDTVGATGAQAYTVVINPAVTVSPAILPNWTVNRAGYSQTVTTSNGTGAKTLSISAGAIPTGMTFTPATGVLNGTPAAANTFNFTVTSTDSVGATGSQAYTLVINPAVVITTATLSDWTVNKAGYSQAILNTGGTGASTFAVTTGAIPTGLALSTGGVLSGTPTVVNTFNFTVTATDTVGATGSQAYTVVINPAIVVSPLTLPNGLQNTAYTQTTTSTGGTGAIAFGVSAGAIPTGLTLTSGGVLSGTPTVANTFNFTITATDTVGATGSQAYTVVILPPITYTVITTGNAITVTNTGGTTDTLAISQPSAGNIQFDVSGRTFTVDGGTPILGGSGPLSLTNVNSITVNAAGGDDIINVGAFTGTLPSLTVNGGTGDDTVNVNGDITFAANAHLDLDLQNDDPTPGTDIVNVATNANILTSGTGSITVKVSRNIAFAAGSSFETVNGGITLEANQQAVPVAGNFVGITITTATVKSTGLGIISLAGRGGDDVSTVNHIGVFVTINATISTVGADITLNGRGGNSSSFPAGAVVRQGATVTTATGNISITGNAGTATAGSSLAYGIYMDLAGTITSTGTGAAAGGITLNGTGGTGVSATVGVVIFHVGTVISAVDGDISVTGVAGAGTGQSNHGVNVQLGAAILSTGTGVNAGNVAVNGTGGLGISGSLGVQVISTGSAISTVDGDISVTGLGGAGTGPYNEGVGVFDNGVIRSTGIGASAGTVTINGTGNGAGGGTESNGVSVRDAGSLITSVDGAISITGTGGTGVNTSGVRIGYNAGVAGAVTSTGIAPIVFIADTVFFDTAASINGGTNTVTVRPKTLGQIINLGGADTGAQLGLTDAELDRITAPTVQIGDSQSGPITISAVISPASYKTLALARDTTFAATGGFISDIGPAATNIENITVTGTLSITAGATLTTAATGGFVPLNGQSFPILTVSGTTAVSGTFAGLPEQQIINPFLGVAINALITYVGGSGNDVVILTNRPPVPGVVTVTRYPTQPVKIPVATIVGAATDPDVGDTISLFSVSNGANGTAQIVGGFVLYTPTGNYPLSHTFSYVIQDNHGTQATGSVTVNVIVDNAGGQNVIRLVHPPGGNVDLDFAGIPGLTYGVQYTDNLANPWQNIGSVTVDTFGAAHFTDTDPVRKAAPSGFYRFIYPAP